MTTDTPTNTTPNPGTDAALAAGCKCPVLDNQHGRGYRGLAGCFVYNLSCPAHKASAEDAS